MNDFDVIVIGAGPAGEVLAGRTASAGLSTAIVESELVGGECSFWACIPSKALLKPLAVKKAAGQLAGLSEVTIDAAAVLEHRDEAIEHLDDSGQVKWLDKKGIKLFRGHGRLDGERRVVVTGDNGEEVLTANRAVVIATGSAAKIPPIEGVDSVPYWDSRDVTTAKEVPGRLAIIGGGVVAVEMAQAWSSLGAEVTMVVRGDTLLERNEPFAGQLILEAFKKEGIDVRFGVSTKKVTADGETKVLHLDNGETVEADQYLLATGRSPRTDRLGLSSVGLEDDGYIDVDDHLLVDKVEGGWLYAIGDVNGRNLLTHMGKYQARIAASHIQGADTEAWADHVAPTGVVFTQPQVASVGKTRAIAEGEGVNVRYVEFDLTGTAAGWLNGDELGKACLVIDDDRRVVIGATFVGSEAGEMLHSATIAIAGEVPLEKLWHAVPSFPTQSEVWLSLMEEYGF